MWRKRLAIILTAAVITTGTLAPAAWADGPGDPIFGDLNNDGVSDRSTLTMLPNDNCAVLVSLGMPGGGYLPTRTYPYQVPGATITACPDMGVAVDLGAKDRVDLVLGWFAGRPPGVNNDLLVLRNFTPAGGFAAIFQPSFMGLADFNGDRRLDIFEWTDQGDGFRTYLNTAAGTLAPGPVQWCSGPLTYELADFDRDGAMDVAISYIVGCADFFSGVVVVLDDGTVTNLEGDIDGLNNWTLNVVDANLDGKPDVVTVNQVTGQITNFIGVGDGTFVAAPKATQDKVTISDTRSTAIAVLANDFATLRTKVSIVAPPSHGTARITSSRTVIYSPGPNRVTSDRFVYRLTDGDKVNNAAVTIRFTTPE